MSIIASELTDEAAGFFAIKSSGPYIHTTYSELWKTNKTEEG